LGAPEPGVGRADRPGCRKHGAAPVKHDEAGILVRKPAERGKRYYPVSADHDQTLETVPDSWQAGLSALRTNTILKNEVATIHTHLDSIAKEGRNAVAWR
jgi:hypothetical protein